ncbi:hypothetical protein Pcac1_g1425 [Phytophthora cactorum]|uniref:Uncharacterized protein n=1 Tax=Phytophthora cactorum TaxID=29920 RepID=A0A8T1C783_9STRA|nr:hypothetical protein Pcac1_g1425 [Phytophthora cactorum]KAG2918472.1 hypothetical protein PC117_g17073 [Phytophthora cactorum]KAG3006554.1 hypothetical protein PC120_g17293 [Phytophthora cactorum]KAG3138735.1 hypothetical protein C6341_g20581 [Phytophthora cactorum]KAG3157474.1 hypothetical protein PC128_g21656 [Phytophthora cactorum]
MWQQLHSTAINDSACRSQRYSIVGHHEDPILARPEDFENMSSGDCRMRRSWHR